MYGGVGKQHCEVGEEKDGQREVRSVKRRQPGGGAQESTDGRGRQCVYRQGREEGQ